MNTHDPLTLGNLLLANLIMMAPVYILVGRGVWYIAQMAERVNQLWKWYSNTQIRGGRRSTDPPDDHAHEYSRS